MFVAFWTGFVFLADNPGGWLTRFGLEPWVLWAGLLPGVYLVGLALLRD
jgi:hypothetical protein